ncbi:I78 family peptidase inhibitor [Lysobacter sp. 2RAF19]
MKTSLVTLRYALAAGAMLALSACTSAPRSESASSGSALPPAAATTTPPMLAASCKAGNAQQFVGKTATPEIVEQARVASGATTARVLTPDQAITMEYRGDRLNVRVGADNVIGSVGCG